MTPEERAAALIARIDVSTDTAALARMIAEEIRAAVEERDAPGGPPVGVAMEPPRIGRALVGRPEGALTGFRVVKHPSYAGIEDDSPLALSLELCCYLCGAREPGPGKTTLYFTTDGYHCESCMYDEYSNVRNYSLSLFPVQYRTEKDVRHSLWDTFDEGGYEAREGLISRLSREIAREMRDDEYLKPFPDIVSMLQRRVFYDVLRKHKGELPEGFELPGPGVEL